MLSIRYDPASRTGLVRLREGKTARTRRLSAQATAEYDRRGRLLTIFVTDLDPTAAEFLRTSDEETLLRVIRAQRVGRGSSADPDGGSFVFSSESVTEGHPDKVADRIADVILDAVLVDDPQGRVACEALVTSGLVVVAGELATEAMLDVPRLVRACVREVGYDRIEWGMDSAACAVIPVIGRQSPDIARGIEKPINEAAPSRSPKSRLGAGDQGMVFGYACRETDELMPLPIMLAHALCRRLAEVRKARLLPYLGPDGKALVTVRYEIDPDGVPQPVELTHVLVSAQHEPGEHVEQHLRGDVIEHVLLPVLPPHLYDERQLGDPGFLLVNPTGRFVIGGPAADTGVTGRKTAVDTYGGAARHGGGAFSGKDPTKVDRSGAYAARHVAKNLVAAGIADRCEIQVSYGIGMARPISLAIDCFGSECIPLPRIEALVHEFFDLRPASIRRDLDLLRPIYTATSAYGHFGRAGEEFTWERTDKAAALRAAAGMTAVAPAR